MLAGHCAFHDEPVSWHKFLMKCVPAAKPGKEQFCNHFQPNYQNERMRSWLGAVWEEFIATKEEATGR